MKSSGSVLRITASLLIMSLLIILFVSDIFGSIHHCQNITVKGFLAGGYLWISITAMLLGLVILYFTKVSFLKRFLLMSVIFLVIVFVPKLFPVKCTFQTPSSLCMLLKPILFLREGVINYPVKFTVTFFTVLLFSVLGNKIFCGWACPIGLLQDVVYSLPLPLKKKNLSFSRMNIIRTTLFLGLITLVIFTGINVFYTYLNPFGPLRWTWGVNSLVITGVIVLTLTIAASLFMYRPYCYTICPIGWITWLLERVSLFGVRFDPSSCTDCRNCITETGCPAVEDIMKEKRWRADCFSCGRCIAECPAGSLRFGITGRGMKKP